MVRPQALEPNHQREQSNTHTHTSCDCYILKDILQNWSDEDAALILRNIHSIMTKNHRLLVIETIMHTGSYSEERVREEGG